MKKLFIIVLLFFLPFCIFAREKRESPFSVSIGPEWNMASRHNFAGGASLGFSYNLPDNFTLGLGFEGSSNFRGTHVIEPGFSLRYYLQNREYLGLFIQADLGAFFMFEDEGNTTLIEFGYRGGYRLPLGNTFFLEPFGRLGFPFAFGIGLLAGIRF